MRKEIVLPYDLYHRIRISSEEHGGIGWGALFTEGSFGVPLCAHGHAWGTCSRYQDSDWYEEPELHKYLPHESNDVVVQDELRLTGHGTSFFDLDQSLRIPFSRWCELLNVKCGPKQGEGVDQPRQALGTLGRAATPEPAGAI